MMMTVWLFLSVQERSAARADGEGDDDDDDIKAQEDQELLDTLADSKENNQGETSLHHWSEYKLS